MARISLVMNKLNDHYTVKFQTKKGRKAMDLVAATNDNACGNISNVILSINYLH